MKNQHFGSQSCFWLLLAAAGCWWLLLVAAGWSWLQLATRATFTVWKTPDSYLKLSGSIWHFLDSFALRTVPHFVFRAVGGFAFRAVCSIVFRTGCCFSYFTCLKRLVAWLLGRCVDIDDISVSLSIYIDIYIHLYVYDFKWLVDNAYGVGMGSTHCAPGYCWLLQLISRSCAWRHNNAFLNGFNSVCISFASLSMLDISQVLFRVCLLLYMFGPWLGPCNSPSVFGGSFCAIHPPWTRDPPTSLGKVSCEWFNSAAFLR